MVIAVDGPAASGKSTVAKKVARRLGLVYADTGKFYRALALAVLNSGVNLDDKSAVERAIADTEISYTFDEGAFRVLLGDDDVTDELGKTIVGEAASRLSALPAVRAALLDLQRSTAQPPGVVMDGRDIGTVVFPDAPFKFYIDASLQVRAERRLKDLLTLDEDITLQQVYDDLAKRDKRDKNRTVAPLRCAEDAIYIDTSELTVEEVIAEVIGTIEEG
ncbi:MAG: (d)CMP kinase [bacterium]|nr:(d)CMP kinase [bacterium]